MSADVQQPKETLEPDSLEAIKSRLLRINSLPEGPQKEKLLNASRDAINSLTQQYDLPVPSEGEALEKWMSRFVNYAGGLARTGLGEMGLTLAGKETPEGAKKRLLDAAVPGGFIPGLPQATKALGFPNAAAHMEATAPTTHAYREAAGMGGEGPAILPENPYFNPHVGSTADFAGDMLTDPALLKSIGQGGYQALLGMAKKPQTADEVAAQLAETLRRQRNPTLFESTKDLAGGVMNASVDPAGTAGEALFRNRFKAADQATRAAGKRRFTDVMLDNQVPGITQQGIREGIDDTLSELNNAREDIHGRAESIAGEDMPTAPTERFMGPINSPRVQKNLRTPGRSAPYAAAQKSVLDDFRESALLDQGVHPADLGYLENGLPPKTVNPVTGEVVQDWETQADNALANKQWTPREADNMATSLQGKAAANQHYSQPGPTELVSKQAQKELLAKGPTAELQNATADEARQFAREGLDQVQSGLGGELADTQGDMASLLEGGKFANRSAFKGKASAASDRAHDFQLGHSVKSSMINALKSTGAATQLGAARALMSPWTRLGLQPAGRAWLTENVDPETNPNLTTAPWTEIQKLLNQGN